MTVINVVAGEYGSTAVTLSQVSSELQGAKIDDLSETVQESMNGAQSISTAGTVESRYTSLLQTHSTALSELASAARSAGVNLDLTEAQNTAAVNSQGQAMPGEYGLCGLVSGGAKGNRAQWPSPRPTALGIRHADAADDYRRGAGGYARLPARPGDASLRAEPYRLSGGGRFRFAPHTTQDSRNGVIQA